MINIHELSNLSKVNQQNKIKVYDEILKDCHAKIKGSAKLNGSITECSFNVPPFKFGLPVYNQKACIIYIVDKLKKNGFTVKVDEDTLLLYISWAKHKQNYFSNADVLDIEKDDSKFDMVIQKLNKEKKEVVNNSNNSNNFKSIHSKPNIKPKNVQKKNDMSVSGSYTTKYYKELNDKYLLND